MEFNGIYLGIVVQNNDPEKRGRVKVFVPHVSANIYKAWYEIPEDKRFKFMGGNIDSDLNYILSDLRKILPWAEVAAPLTSEDASGRYNSYHNMATVSDSNFFTNTLNMSSNAPGEFYEKKYNRLSDGFEGEIPWTNNPNPYSYMYKPSTFSNKAKGSFGIPSVGSHVYVFFINGDVNSPVIMAAQFGQQDWKGVYDDQDYPGKYENGPVVDNDANIENYRNKYVINQKGGSLEFVNSDLNEKVKISHYSGSFKEMNNNVNIELATKNDQTLVLNDQYNTVRGDRNDSIGKNFDQIIIRDKYKKIGNLNEEFYIKWKGIVDVIQDVKQLFSIKRAEEDNIVDDKGAVILRRTSTQQKRVGEFRTFPVTDGSITYLTVNGEMYKDLTTQLIDIISETGIKFPEGLDPNNPPIDPDEYDKWIEDMQGFILDSLPLLDESVLKGLSDVVSPYYFYMSVPDEFVENNPSLYSNLSSLSSLSGVEVVEDDEGRGSIWPLEAVTVEVAQEQLTRSEYDELVEFTALSVDRGLITSEARDDVLGFFIEVKPQEGVPAGYIPISSSEGNGPMDWEPVVVSTFQEEFPSEETWEKEAGRKWGPGGKGKSISSFEGKWEVETKKNKENLQQLIQVNLQQLTEYENKLGIGGSEIIEVAKHKVETIGLVMNDFGSVRYDNIGKLVNNEVLISTNVTYVNKSDTPLVEYVHVQDLPGGNYSLNVCNRYNVMVGAGGMFMKAYGPVDISGTITNMAGEQVNIGSSNEVNINAKTIDISGEILRLRSKRQRQVLVDSSLGVSNNLIIGGGLYVEGEIYTHHISAPLEWQITNPTIALGTPRAGKIIGTDSIGGPVIGTGAEPDSIEVHEHSHIFPNVPLTLYDSHNRVRSAATLMNTGSARQISDPVTHGYKGPETDETFKETLNLGIEELIEPV